MEAHSAARASKVSTIPVDGPVSASSAQTKTRDLKGPRLKKPGLTFHTTG